MRSTIDRAGRLVVPKAIRDRMGLSGGDSVDITERDGEIVISRPRDGVQLVETERGLLTATSPDLPGLGPDEVRDLLERTRR
jgi:AbrB family looped-hinge helix DNA binding protein